ncbi:uncharacterized protein ACNS7B_023829 isoform 1-T1 [Menidia menidia]
MDKLRSELDSLSVWLSEDPDYIIDECGDILTVNEYKEVKKQANASDKMKMLLNTIIDQGGDTCRSFLDILKKSQEHYPQLEQFFNPRSHGSNPSVFADKSSVVTAQRFCNTTAKSLSMKIEAVTNPKMSPSGNAGISKANYTATDGSIICADEFRNVNIDGSIDISVSVKPSQDPTGVVEETEHLPQKSKLFSKSSIQNKKYLKCYKKDPDVKMIIDNKIKLADCLMADRYILQHAQQDGVICLREYNNIKEHLSPEIFATNLIDTVIGKGTISCSKFLQVLKKADVLETYPQLKEILNIDAEQ